MKTLRHAATLLLLLLTSPLAQPAEGPASADEAAVLAVVQRFLDSLATRDVAANRATISPEGQLQSLRESAGANTVGYRLLGEFADRLPTWKEPALERIWNPTILVQGRIAIVWAPYDFHRGGKFSHSGIDVFTLMRADDEWKIVSLAFTMQPQVPSAHPAGPPQ